jgi:tetratricopeptide (TPR) repeat protein
MLAMAGGVVLPSVFTVLPVGLSSGAAMAQELGESGGGKDITPASIKSDFDAAMGKPLSERIPDLEAIDQKIGEAMREQSLAKRDRLRLLEMEYLIRVNTAKYPDATETFGRYAAELKSWDQPERARAALMSQVDRVSWGKDESHHVELIDQALESWPNDPDVTPRLLYKKAQVLIALNGRTPEAIPALNKIIEEHMESAYRPRAYRDLAALQASGVKDAGGARAALQTLTLMEQQYRGTKWEQVAHILAAEVFEKKQGEPQKALARYQESLKKFPDHWFATHCRKQIDRLQLVIEEQLIRDALEGLGKKDAEQPDDADADVKVGQAEEEPATDPVSEIGDAAAPDEATSPQAGTEPEPAVASVSRGR